MTTKKKKKAKKSSPGRSAPTSPSSSTQTSGDNKQQTAQSTASSSPVNCDLAAADIAGSDTNPFSDLLLEHNATGQIENGAIDLDLMDNDEIPSTPTKEFVGITQETSTNQSALPAVVVNPELQDIGAAAPSSAKSIVSVSSETTTPKSVLPAVVAKPESQDLGDAAPSSAKPTVVVSSETTTPKSAISAAVVNPESQVQGDTTPKTTEKGKEIDHHPLPAGNEIPSDPGLKSFSKSASSVLAESSKARGASSVSEVESDSSDEVSLHAFLTDFPIPMVDRGPDSLYQLARPRAVDIFIFECCTIKPAYDGSSSTVLQHLETKKQHAAQSSLSPPYGNIPGD
ncbi:hypothetical protein DY000_02051791 [Brassica cretica]|uniref:Uncharacterized protein n=1 Tax=Brassica cretica TaxID=69181 RepID=A0ABQ7AF81_BRACR|nr:hypothetical protein DY000_02051791 [Brassica cretica]